MARSQTFSVSLNLLTKNFQKGVKTIQSSLNNLKMQFRNFAAALGAGIGISEVMSNMVESAKKLDKAQTTLRNVSSGIEAYGENQKFVMDLSKKYNQELTTLMGNYAKFHSAANMAGMSLLEQQHIYESLTRAAAFYNLTADETNGVMLAVNQMISKGKVSSEELRRQLGERLPGAMNLAAQAMGVSTAELDKMIRDGKVMATDLLPRLADELNKVTKNVNVDSIQGAIARLQNSFTTLVQKLNIGKVYRNLINGVSGGLDYIANNLKSVAQSIAIVLGTLASKPLFQKIHNTWTDLFEGLESSIKASEKKLLRLKESAMIQSSRNGIKIDMDTLQPMGAAPVDPKALKSYERLKQIADDYADTQVLLNKQQDEFNNKLGTMSKRLGAGLKQVLKFVGIQAAYYAIAAAISTIVTKLVSWYKEQQRIRNLVRDTQKEFKDTSDALGVDEVELTELQKSLKIENERERAIRKINQLLGLQGKSMFTLESSNDDINKAIEKRLKLLREEREYQAMKQIVTDAQNRKTQLEKENETLALLDEGGVAKEIGKMAGKGSLGTRLITSIWADKKLENAYKNNAKEIEQLNKIIEKFTNNTEEGAKNLKDYILSSPDREAALNNTPPDSGNLDIEKEYQEIQDEYNKNLRTLNEQKKHNLITEDEYNKELEKLVLKTAESILALNDVDENVRPFAKGILDAAKAYVANAQKEDKVKEELDKYYKSVKALYNQYNNGVITHKELEDELYSLLQETILAVSAMGDLSGAAEKLAQSFNKQKRDKTLDTLGKESAPKMGEFDTTLSYKKDASEMYQENADYIREYSSELKTYIDTLKEYKDELTGDDLKQLNTYIEELETNLDTLTTQADSFAQAAKFAEIQEDIKNMKKELAEGIWDNISGIATAAERLTNSFKSMKETMNDPDVSGWEKFITIFTTIISTIETIVSVIKTFNTALQIAEGLSMAMTAAEAAGIPVEIEKIALMTAEAQIAKQVAVAKHMSAAASVPYPANLAAIASTSAALAAAFAAIPAFASGGIIQGSSTTGDKNIARVNAGEMILNKAQQATLFSAIASGNLGGSGNVSFEIRGDKLVGVLNNYQKKISK